MRKIALIEDNPDNRLLVATLLEDLYEVTEYESGPVALEKMRTDRPDLVLLDISLPKMSGEEVLRRLREEPHTASLPVVALTAHAMHGDRDRFLQQGFDGYLAKPIVDEEDLLAVIRQLLAGGA